MKKRWICAGLLVCWLSCLTTGGMAWAQTGTSRVTGLVLDQSGAAVVGATVLLTNQATGVSYNTVTTDVGTYLFDAIPPSTYTVRIEVSGFKTFVSKNNVLSVGLPLTVNAKLEVGATTTVVEVTESFERVQTSTSGNFGAIVDDRTLRDLPLGLDSATGGRNPLNFVRLQPGVNAGANTGGGSHVNGSRDRSFNYTLDGIDINESSAGGSEFSPLRTNPDSLQEFRVITGNATAEYGRNSGAQIEMRTRSGTNSLHGSVFYFHRNSALAANEWGNKTGPVFIKRGFLLQHQWGFSVGGPIFKNRTFFFMNYQGQKQVVPFTRTRTVYTADARLGKFRYRAGSQNGNAASSNPSINSSGSPLFPDCTATLNVGCINTYDIVAQDPRTRSAVGTGGLDPTMLSGWIGLTPLPNDFTTGDGLNTAGYTFSGGRFDPQRDFVIKIDHKFDDSNTIFVRYAWGRQDTTNDTTNAGEPRFPRLSEVVHTQRKPSNAAVNYRRVINPHMVNEFVGGFNRFTFDFATPTAGKTLPYITNLPTDPLVNDRGNLRTINTYQLVDNLSWVKGAHAMRMGINFRYQQHIDIRGSVGGFNSELEVTFGQTVATTCASGSYAFPLSNSGVVAGQERFCLPPVNPTTGTPPAYGINSSDRSRMQSMINDLLGRVGQLQQGFVSTDDLQSWQPAGATFRNDARYGEYDFYFQDSWRLRSNLVVDLGIRWELKGHPTNPRGRIFQPDQPAIFGAPASTTLNWVHGPLYKNDYNNVAPSIGVAWDPFKTGKTSIRANYRMAFDRINTFVISSQIFNAIPGLSTGVVNTAFGQNGGTGGTAGRLRDGLPALAPTRTPQSLTQPDPYGAGTMAVIDPGFQTPRTHLWQFDIQREIWKGITVDIAYIGRKANHLFGAYDANAVNIFAQDAACNENFLQAFQVVQSGGQSCLVNKIYLTDSRVTSGTGSDFVRAQLTSSVTNGAVAAVAADASTRRLTYTPPSGPAFQVPPFFCATRSGTTCTSLSGMPLTFFRPFPQFAVLRVLDSNDFSNYHGLQVVVSRKFARNLNMQFSYTFSKSLDNRSFDPAFSVVSTGAVQSASSTPFDLRNRRLNYARSDFDRTHILIGYAMWDLPFGPKQRWGGSAPKVVQRFIEGWEINGVFTAETGRPFTVYSGFSQLSNIVNSPANCTGCPRDMGSVTLQDAAFANLPSYFNATERARFSQPAPGTIGNTGRNYFTGPGYWNLDAAILKRTTIRESMNAELRFEFFNVTNSPMFSFPSLTIPPTGGTSTTFGRISGVNNEARKIRVGLKINF